MRQKILRAMFTVLFPTAALGTPDYSFTFGPMFHLNFGEHRKSLSWGFEVSYWNFQTTVANLVVPSIDIGFDIQGKKKRIYSEFQMGVALGGISAGPVVEIGEGPKFGLQSSIWADCFAGVDYRMRWIDNTRILAPGIFVKCPHNLAEFVADAQ